MTTHRQHCTCQRVRTLLYPDALNTTRIQRDPHCLTHGDEPACIGCSFADLDLDNPVVIGKHCPRHDPITMKPSLRVKMSEPTHDPFTAELQRNLERVIASRMAARDAEMTRLTIGILSGREGTSTAMLLYDPNGVPHGVWGGHGDPYTIVEQLPLHTFAGQAGFAIGELPRVVHTIPQKWHLTLDDAQLGEHTRPITMGRAARLIEQQRLVFDFTLDGVAHVRLKPAPQTTDASAPAQREEHP